MQLIYYTDTDTYNYSDKQSIQNMVAIISSPFTKSYSTDLDILTVAISMQSTGTVRFEL